MQRVAVPVTITPPAKVISTVLGSVRKILGTIEKLEALTVSWSEVELPIANYKAACVELQDALDPKSSTATRSLQSVLRMARTGLQQEVADQQSAVEGVLDGVAKRIARSALMNGFNVLDAQSAAKKRQKLQKSAAFPGPTGESAKFKAESELTYTPAAGVIDKAKPTDILAGITILRSQKPAIHAAVYTNLRPTGTRLIVPRLIKATAKLKAGIAVLTGSYSVTTRADTTPKEYKASLKLLKSGEAPTEDITVPAVLYGSMSVREASDIAAEMLVQAMPAVVASTKVVRKALRGVKETMPTALKLKSDEVGAAIVPAVGLWMERMAQGVIRPTISAAYPLKSKTVLENPVSSTSEFESGTVTVTARGQTISVTISPKPQKLFEVLKTLVPDTSVKATEEGKLTYMASVLASGLSSSMVVGAGTEVSFGAYVDAMEAGPHLVMEFRHTSAINRVATASKTLAARAVISAAAFIGTPTTNAELCRRIVGAVCPDDLQVIDLYPRYAEEDSSTEYVQTAVFRIVSGLDVSTPALNRIADCMSQIIRRLGSERQDALSDVRQGMINDYIERHGSMSIAKQKVHNGRVILTGESAPCRAFDSVRSSKTGHTVVVDGVRKTVKADDPAWRIAAVGGEP